MEILDPYPPKRIIRFWMKVKVGWADDCWPWAGSRDGDGYGSFRLGRVVRRTHRIALELVTGPLLREELACHSCDVRYPVGDIAYRLCCNPGHLWKGSCADNLRDAASKRRMALGVRNGTHTHPERVTRGEQHPDSKLTANDVRRIRDLYAAGQSTQTALAREYGLTQGAIGHLIRRVTWKHVT